jgi:hypothetical protein
MKIRTHLLILTLPFWFGACKEKYDIKVSSSAQSVLVVDGNLNSGIGETSIRLTRTVPKNDTTSINAESNDLVTVEGSDNSIQTLVPIGDGFYNNPQLNMLTGTQYRLRIKATDGRTYLSDYAIVKNNPPIDSINWKRTNDGVTIYSNTHDPQNNTWYYRWEYAETYEFHSRYNSTYKYLPATNEVVPRDQSESVFICWRTNLSTEILLGSSSKLQSDVIFENPLQFIPAGSEKLAIRYSILVKQYSLTKEAYDYLQVMKKNTESIGSIFGVLPAELSGNIHCLSNPSEQVIGFITISPVHETRIFINNSELSDWNFQMPCIEVLVANNPDSMKLYFNTFVPIAAFYGSSPNIIAWYSSDINCVDCVYRGGTTVKPSFW